MRKRVRAARTQWGLQQEKRKRDGGCGLGWGAATSNQSMAQQGSSKRKYLFHPLFHLFSDLSWVPSEESSEQRGEGGWVDAVHWVQPPWAHSRVEKVFDLSRETENSQLNTSAYALVRAMQTLWRFKTHTMWPVPLKLYYWVPDGYKTAQLVLSPFVPSLELGQLLLQALLCCSHQGDSYWDSAYWSSQYISTLRKFWN